MDSNNQVQERLLFSMCMMIQRCTSGEFLDPHEKISDQLDDLAIDFLDVKRGIISFEIHHGMEIPAKAISISCSLEEMVLAAAEEGRIPDELFEAYLNIKIVALDQLLLQHMASLKPTNDELVIDLVHWHLKD